MTYKNRISGSSLLRAEGFFCSLDVLFGGIGIGKLHFLSKKYFYKIFRCKFLSIFGHQNAGSGSGSGSGINEYGSETLVRTFPVAVL
jgi:hypothetical protein